MERNLLDNGWNAGIARAIHFYIGAQGCENPDEADGILLADKAGKSLIHAACTSGNLAVVKWLVQHDAALDAQDNAGMQPIHCACAWGHLEVLEWLHAAGAAIDATDGTGVQPMHVACSSGRLDIVQHLHAWGADIACRDGSGMQPVHAASACGHTAVGIWLKSMGAAIDARDNNGVQPLAYACVSGHAEMATWIRSEMGMQVNMREALEWARECKAANAAAIVELVLLWAQEAADCAAEALWAEEDGTATGRLKERRKPAAKRRGARMSRAGNDSRSDPSLLHAATEPADFEQRCVALMGAAEQSLAQSLCTGQVCTQEIGIGASDAALSEAIASGNLEQIKAAIKAADSLGCEARVLCSARAVRDKLKKSERKQTKRVAAAAEALRVLEACEDRESLVCAAAAAQPYAQYSAPLLTALADVPDRLARLADSDRASAKAHYIEKLDDDLLSLQLARLAQAEHRTTERFQVPSESKHQAAASGDEESCCVCLDARRTHCFVPCGHLCVCLACATSLFGGPCPVCRVPCQQAVKVFFA